MPHLNDQQTFARVVRESLYWKDHPSVPTYRGVDMDRSAGADFRAHFPSVAQAVDHYNAAVSDYQAASKAASDHRSCLIEDVGAISAAGQSLVGFISSMMNGDIRLADVEWSVRDGQIMVNVTPPSRLVVGLWGLATVPSSTDQMMKLVDRLYSGLAELEDGPVGLQLAEATSRLATSRAEVDERLDDAIRTHELTGRCERCQWK